jgi:hypothetical protein
MTIPIWVATVLLVSVLGVAGYLTRLVLEHERRITRIESKLNGKQER